MPWAYTSRWTAYKKPRLVVPDELPKALRFIPSRHCTSEKPLGRGRRIQSLGERIAVRDPDRQTAEIHLRVALMNRVNALGTAEIVRVA